MSETKEVPTCPICIDHFTAVIRQPITCQYCPSAACRQCTSNYLLQTLNDPHCFGCKREWNREFIDTKLTQTFRKGALRQHRRKVLMDRERGRLPAMQVFVEARKEYAANQEIYLDCVKKRRELKRKRNAIQVLHAATDTPEQLIERLRPINAERTELKIKQHQAHVKMIEANEVLTGKKREVRQFIMKCPAEECRGFLSSAWKCGTCQKFFCSECHAEKAGQKDEDHTCNPDAKATAAMIKQETKPCPKCGIRISKIDGCDQMWCTSCQTTFSWNSGQILHNTVVHNPHYYEYLRQRNNGVVPREAGDVPCGGLPNAYTFTRDVMKLHMMTQDKKTELLDIVRCLSDIQYVRLPQYPLRQPAEVNRDVDIAYLMKEITEDQWGTQLEQIESKGEQKKEIGLILQTLLHVGSEKLTQLQNELQKFGNTLTTDKQIIEKRAAILFVAESTLKEMNNVRIYTNKCLIEKGNQMGIVVPQIPANWRWMKVRKADMKTISAEESVSESSSTLGPLPDLPPSPPPVPRDGGDDTEDEEETTVMVEIGGEIVEMTRAQAQQILA